MKVLVPIKRVIDYNVMIEVKSDGSGVEQDRVKMSMNPFDEIALEEAIKLKETMSNVTVEIITVGSAACQDILRQGLAMGADSATHVLYEKSYGSLDIAKILKEHNKKDNFDLILMGKQAIDGDHHQTAEMLAALLGWPIATQASHIDIDENIYTVDTEVDGGTRTLKFEGPCVISVDLRLNQPRYVTLPNLMKARQQTIHKITPNELNIDIPQRTSIVSVSEPQKRSGGPVFTKIEDFLEACKNAGVFQ